MAHREPFAETVTRFETPAHHHVLIRAPNGGFLVHKIVGPGGQVGIAPDRELTALTRDGQQASAR